MSLSSRRESRQQVKGFLLVALQELGGYKQFIARMFPLGSPQRFNVPIMRINRCPIKSRAADVRHNVAMNLDLLLLPTVKRACRGGRPCCWREAMSLTIAQPLTRTSRLNLMSA